MEGRGFSHARTSIHRSERHCGATFLLSLPAHRGLAASLLHVPSRGDPDGGASLVTMTGEEEEKVVSDPIALEASTERIPVTYTHISVVKRVTQPCLPARR